MPDTAAFCPHCGKPTGALAALVDAAREGSQAAVSALYEQTYSKVYYTVKSMIKDEDAVLDILQDAYIKAFAHLDSFEGGQKFLPWVRQIAANTARDWLKKKRPMLFTELNSGDAQDTPVEELLPDERSADIPEQVIDQEETRRLLREIIDELPEDQRAAIGMFYYEEMSVREIAAAMEVSESAVKSRLLYGRNKIEKKVRELEKRGTKLYGLAPVPFLLLLLRSQGAYGIEVPNSRVRSAILAAQPTGAGVVRAAKPAAGGAAAKAAVSGGLGALKIAAVAVAAVAAVALGAVGAVRLADRFGEPGHPASAGEEAASPLDAAMEQYRAIIGQADSYEYASGVPDLETLGYRYALVQMQPDNPVPALLLEKQEGGWATISNIRVFQYDPQTETVHQPAKLIASGVGGGGYRGSLGLAGDGIGLMSTEWSSGTGEATVTRITLDGDALSRETYWTGRIDLMPDTITFKEIDWHEIEDLSALEGWTAPGQSGAEPDDSEALPADGNRIVLTGTVGTYDYDGMVALQGGVDPFAGWDEASVAFYREQTYRVIVLDAPQTLSFRVSGGGSDAAYSTREASMFSIDGAAGMEPYEGQHITFSVDPDEPFWPSETSLPLGQPIARDIHVLA